MNKHSGSNFDDFLAEEGILEEVSAKAHKRLLALQVPDHVNLRDYLLTNKSNSPRNLPATPSSPDTFSLPAARNAS